MSKIIVIFFGHENRRGYTTHDWWEKGLIVLNLFNWRTKFTIMQVSHFLFSFMHSLVTVHDNYFIFVIPSSSKFVLINVWRKVNRTEYLPFINKTKIKCETNVHNKKFIQNALNYGKVLIAFISRYIHSTFYLTLL